MTFTNPMQPLSERLAEAASIAPRPPMDSRVRADAYFGGRIVLKDILVHRKWRPVPPITTKMGWPIL